MTLLDANKILLVHPLGYTTGVASPDIARLANLMPPLGLVSLAAYLKTQNIEPTIVDCFAQPDSDHLIADFLKTEKPAFMGVSCTTSSFLDGIRLTELAKSTLPDLKVVFGGTHVSAMKEKVLEHFQQIDFTVVGEGELPLAGLLRNGPDSTCSTRGVIYREAGGGVCFTGHQEPGVDLDTLPFPAYDQLKGYPEAYALPIFNYPTTPNSSCVSSRGCPYVCSYCDRSVFRRTYRYNSAEYLYAHLHYLNERFGIRHITFYDDQFTLSRERVEDFTRMLIDRPLGMTFNCAVRAEHIDSDLLRQMKAAGCWMISLGVETGDERLLAQHRQNADLHLLAERIRMIKRAGIRVKALLMMGLPGETQTSIKRSMEYVFSLPIDDLNIAKFTPFPGSPIYQEIHDFGVFDEDWEKMDCMNFVFIPKGLDRERIEKLFTQFYKSHFLRPKVILNYITMLWRSPDSWLRFLQNVRSFLRYARTNRRLGDGRSKPRRFSILGGHRPFGEMGQRGRP